jgi:hypothetical protein
LPRPESNPALPRNAERDTYLVLDDFRDRLGCPWRETDAESADRATLMRDPGLNASKFSPSA